MPVSGGSHYDGKYCEHQSIPLINMKIVCLYPITALELMATFLLPLRVLVHLPFEIKKHNLVSCNSLTTSIKKN